MLGSLRRFDESLAGFAEVLAHWSTAVGTETFQVGCVLLDRALVHDLAGHGAAAMADVDRALDILEKIEIEDRNEYVSAGRHLRGCLRMANHQLADAESDLRTALDCQRTWTPESSPFAQEVLNSLGECLCLQGRQREGMELLRSSLQSLEASLGEGHPKTAAARERANRWNVGVRSQGESKQRRMGR